MCPPPSRRDEGAIRHPWALALFLPRKIRHRSYRHTHRRATPHKAHPCTRPHLLKCAQLSMIAAPRSSGGGAMGLGRSIGTVPRAPGRRHRISACPFHSICTPSRPHSHGTRPFEMRATVHDRRLSLRVAAVPWASVAARPQGPRSQRGRPGGVAIASLPTATPHSHDLFLGILAARAQRTLVKPPCSTFDSDVLTCQSSINEEPRSATRRGNRLENAVSDF